MHLRHGCVNALGCLLDFLVRLLALLKSLQALSLHTAQHWLNPDGYEGLNDFVMQHLAHLPRFCRHKKRRCCCAPAVLEKVSSRLFPERRLSCV